MTASEAVRLLNGKELCSEEILGALVMRCTTVGKDLNIYTATNFSWALQAARECDQKRRESEKKNWTFEDGKYSDEEHFPPLFGIPISVKDVYNVDSMTTTLGISSRAMDYGP
jgi:Asp-tRNA(Asn)/Glu-tRNA(Gln) amidotransferase A subunit family amidase